MELQEIFLQMQKLPKGYIIESPHDLIRTSFKLSKDILHIIKTDNQDIFFTRLSIKHLAEKGIQGEYIMNKINTILSNPESIHSGNFTNRFLISKKIIFGKDFKNHIINIEITKDENNIIVTGFMARNSYFKNLKLLWGTAPSPSQQLSKE